MQLPTLIGFHDKGRAGVIRAGKFVRVRSLWVYCYNIEERLRFMDGFGVAPCVLTAMEEADNEKKAGYWQRSWNFIIERMVGRG